MLNRRQTLVRGAAVFAGVAAAHAQPAPSPAVPPPLRVAARDAWLWGLPLIEMAAQRSARFAEGVAPNTYQHQRALVGAADQFVTTPNNDTLYSQAWLDLSAGPVRLTLPATSGRYLCVPLMDMYSNNFAVLGTRTTGADGGAFTVVGPSDATTNPFAVRSPTRWVWVLGRTLVDGDEDLRAAHLIQDQLRIEGPVRSAPQDRYAARSASWEQFFASVQTLMNENPPPATDKAVLDRVAPLLRLGATFDPGRFSADEIGEIRDGVADAQKAMGGARRALPSTNGWSYPGAGLGDFGQSYLYRALVAVGGLGALPRAEAMYLRAAGSGGTGFDGAKTWTLTFRPKDLPPVDGFWSLSMYRMTSDGQLFFAENPIGRYAIGDRTRGLRRGAGDALTITMSRDKPSGDAAANWLPAPADGNFVLILRAYMPRAELVDGLYRVPPVEPA